VQDLRQSLRTTAHIAAAKTRRDFLGVVDALGEWLVENQAIGEWRELAGEELRAFSVDCAEGAGADAALQVHHANRRAGADRSAEDGLDLVAARARQILNLGSP
jgi:hypothetical protein